MKRVISFLVAVGVLVSGFWTGANRAQAAGLIMYRGGVFVEGKGIAFVFDASGYRNRDVRGADILVASNFHNLGCTVNREEAKIVCVLRGGLTEHAGETGIIHLAGQVFYVTIPNRILPEVEEEEYLEEDDGSEGEATFCGDLEVLGAWVTFEYLDEEPYFYDEFIEGASPEDVDAIVQEMMSADEAILSYEIGEFGCYEVYEEGLE